MTVVTGEGGPLLERARDAGLETLLEPALVPNISPRSDPGRAAPAHPLLRVNGTSTSCTPTARRPAPWAGSRPHRARVPVIAHTFHGFPFHDFQSRLRRTSYITAERRLAQITDVKRRDRQRGGGGGRPTPDRVDRRTAHDHARRRRARRATDAGEPQGRPRASGIPDDVPPDRHRGPRRLPEAPEHLRRGRVQLRHRNAQIVWVGGGPGLDEAHALVTRLGLVDRFHFVGERRDVADVLPAFDVFVMSSRYEGLPCALVEAMRCGLPVVATTVNSVPDLVAPGETGLLVPPARPEALACALDHLLDHPAVADRLAAIGQEAADSRFDTDRLGLVLDEAFTEALTGRPPGVHRPGAPVGGTTHEHRQERAPTGTPPGGLPSAGDRANPRSASPALGRARTGRRGPAPEPRGARVAAARTRHPGRPGRQPTLRAPAPPAQPRTSPASVCSAAPVLPDARHPLVVVDDDDACIALFWQAVAMVPPGLTRAHGVATLVLRVLARTSPT